MTLPSQLTIADSAYALDGGTIFLRATDETGQEHTIMLVQHAFPQTGQSLDPVPGRLYFDGHLVPQRSEFEAGVLGLLRSANARYGGMATEHDRSVPSAPDQAMQAMTRSIIQFVESDQYLSFAERVEQAADPTRYDVRVAWDAANRKQVVVRLGRFLGIGLRAAEEMVQQDRPFAEGVTALEVTNLAARFRAQGLGVRVSPAFRWPLT